MDHVFYLTDVSGDYPPSVLAADESNKIMDSDNIQARKKITLNLSLSPSVSLSLSLSSSLHRALPVMLDEEEVT